MANGKLRPFYVQSRVMATDAVAALKEYRKVMPERVWPDDEDDDEEGDGNERVDAIGFCAATDDSDGYEQGRSRPRRRSRR